MIILPPLEAFVPVDHRLRRLHGVLDVSFVHETVRSSYCQDNGRPSVDPEVIIRLFVIQAVEGISHVRELMRQVQVNLAYRWFIGYELDEELPDHSTVSRAFDRMGDEVFNNVFSCSIAQCQTSGLIEGKVLHVDATTVRADLDKQKVNKVDSPDGDARFGRFGDGTKQPGYKQHTVVDDTSRVVVAVTVTAANHSEEESMLGVVDQARDRLARTPEVLCADSAYASASNQAGCEARGIRLVRPPRKPKSAMSEQYFGIEQFSYDEEVNEFICPAGQRLRCVGSFSGRRERRKYRASRHACRPCDLKAQCTVAPQRCLNAGVHHGALVRLWADSLSESFRSLYRRRAPVIEGIFAEAKERHGLRRAWRRGLSKMRLQCLLIAAVMNFKRVIAHGQCPYAALYAIQRIINALRQNLGSRQTFPGTVSIDQQSKRTIHPSLA